MLRNLLVAAVGLSTVVNATYEAVTTPSEDVCAMIRKTVQVTLTITVDEVDGKYQGKSGPSAAAMPVNGWKGDKDGDDDAAWGGKGPGYANADVTSAPWGKHGYGGDDDDDSAWHHGYGADSDASNGSKGWHHGSDDDDDHHAWSYGDDDDKDWSYGGSKPYGDHDGAHVGDKDWSYGGSKPHGDHDGAWSGDHDHEYDGEYDDDEDCDDEDYEDEDPSYGSSGYAHGWGPSATRGGARPSHPAGSGSPSGSKHHDEPSASQHHGSPSDSPDHPVRQSSHPLEGPSFSAHPSVDASHPAGPSNSAMPSFSGHADPSHPAEPSFSASMSHVMGSPSASHHAEPSFSASMSHVMGSPSASHPHESASAGPVFHSSATRPHNGNSMSASHASFASASPSSQPQCVPDLGTCQQTSDCCRASDSSTCVANICTPADRCLNDGEGPCSSTADCCNVLAGSTCINQMCTAPTQCGAPLDSCEGDNDCCSGGCVLGKCQVPAPQCIPDNDETQLCTFTAQCCNTINRTTCQSGTCTPFQCISDGESRNCATSADCCGYDAEGGGSFCNALFFCEAPAQCKSDGDSCEFNSECCSSACSGITSTCFTD